MFPSCSIRDFLTFLHVLLVQYGPDDVVRANVVSRFGIVEYIREKGAGCIGILLPLEESRASGYAPRREQPPRQNRMC